MEALAGAGRGDHGGGAADRLQLQQQFEFEHHQRSAEQCWRSGWQEPPSLLVLREPTQAVDVGARHDIINAIREAARDGCGAVIASIDAADLAVLCDRVLVFRDGEVAAELTGELDQDNIIHATFGVPQAAEAEVAGEKRWVG